MPGPLDPDGHPHHDVPRRRADQPGERKDPPPVRRAAAAAPDAGDWFDPSAWWAMAAAAVALTGPIGIAPALPAVVTGTVLALIGTAVIMRRIRDARTRPMLRSAGLTVMVTLALGFGTFVALLPGVPPSA